MTTERQPTLQDVAAHAGVSHQTVSRYLNAPVLVRSETAARIASAIDVLGYRRNLAARVLASKRSHAIGVIAREVADYGPTSTVHALESAARERGYRLIVATCLDSRGSVDDGLLQLLEQSVEAIVVVAPNTTTAALGDQVAGRPVLTTASIDQYTGIALAMGHLLHLGHRRIQHVAGPPHYTEALDRLDAFTRVAREAGLPALPTIEGDWSARSGYLAGGAILPGTTAVCCANDQMALGLVAGLRAHGRRVPEDVSIVGFDDVPEAEFFDPPLTTVRQDFERLGRVTVDRVAQLLNGQVAEGQAIRPRLVVRNSTRPIGEFSDGVRLEGIEPNTLADF